MGQQRYVGHVNMLHQRSNTPSLVEAGIQLTFASILEVRTYVSMIRLVRQQQALLKDRGKVMAAIAMDACTRGG